VFALNLGTPATPIFSTSDRNAASIGSPVCAHTPVTRETGHTHNKHDKNNTTNKQPHERIPPSHSTTLKGGATAVRTTTHARVGD